MSHRSAAAAPFRRRLVADLIDLAFLGALAVGLWYAGVLRPDLPLRRFDWLDYAADLLANHLSVFRPAAGILICLGLVYAILCRAFLGATFGERLLRLELVAWDGAEAGPFRTLAHALGTLVGLSLLLLGYAWAAVDIRRQGLGEYLSGTRLIRAD